MTNITQHLRFVSLDSRSGSPPGRRILAFTLVVMLAFGGVFPGFAVAGESDSEGEGTAPPVEVPVDPSFDPGGEEEALEEAPAAGGDEETGSVEAEAEVDLEAPPAGEVTNDATETPIEAAPPSPVLSPEPTTSATDPEPAQQQASGPTEPVANESIIAPKQVPDERSTASESTVSSEAATPAELAPQEAPSPSPQPVAVMSPDSGRSLAGKGTYVVGSGDCLWHIAAGLLPAGAGDAQIAQEVQRLWRLNEDRIGTGDPNLLLVGTELRVI